MIYLSFNSRIKILKTIKILDSNGQTKIKLLPNTLVEILSGTERGRYGKVQSMDEDNASCFVELAKTGNIVRVSQYNLRTIEKNKTEANLDKYSSKYESKRSDSSKKHLRKHLSDYHTLSRR